MSIVHSSRFLRSVLIFDAAVCLSSVPVLLAFSGSLATLTGLSTGRLGTLAIINLLFGALIAFVASRSMIPRQGVLAVISLNALWGAGTVLLALSGWLPLTHAGFYLVIGQGVAALVAAELEWIGLRRLPSLVPAA